MADTAIIGDHLDDGFAELDLDDATFFASYTAEVTQHSPDTARKRLAMAKRRAVMICDGIELWPNDDTHAEVPAADIEIDLDIESDQNNRVYMWGVRVRRGTDEATGIYVPDFTAWDPVDEESEYALAQRFADWLRQQCAAAAADGKSLRVFHWSSPEWSNLRRILGADAVRDLIGDRDGTDQAIPLGSNDCFPLLLIVVRVIVVVVVVPASIAWAVRAVVVVVPALLGGPPNRLARFRLSVSPIHAVASLTSRIIRM